MLHENIFNKSRLSHPFPFRDKLNNCCALSNNVLNFSNYVLNLSSYCELPSKLVKSDSLSLSMNATPCLCLLRKNFFTSYHVLTPIFISLLYFFLYTCNNNTSDCLPLCFDNYKKKTSLPIFSQSRDFYRL